jgi:hypothetical protein
MKREVRSQKSEASNRTFDHTYVWGNNEKRKTLKGQKCRILARMRMNSIVIEFENGEQEVTSRYAIRKEK